MDRDQLNLALNARPHLLKMVEKEAAAEGLSVDAWIVKTWDQALIDVKHQEALIEALETLINKIEEEK